MCWLLLFELLFPLLEKLIAASTHYSVLNSNVPFSERPSLFSVNKLSYLVFISFVVVPDIYLSAYLFSDFPY